jgi:hypothetical protein
MKNSIIRRIMIASIIVILLESSWISLPGSQSIGHVSTQPLNIIDGHILFAPTESQTAYVIDNTGTVNHTWSSDYFPGEAVCWLGNGTILRTIKTDFNGYGGSGGGVQKVLWNGTIVWDFRYDTNGNLSHHDIMPLPNGNVLMIAWETKTQAEAIAAGRNPSDVSSSGLMPDHIIEVKQTGPTSGDIVWEWHVWDHLIQDYDSSKTNYGVVADHPELVDINYGITLMSLTDWLHTNSIDYNEKFDQIIISVNHFNEIWVIDHSTTTEEAAGHTGGNSGKGGDLLYRWGNPEAYRTGTTSDQKLFSQHDTSWIKPGCPGAGHILIFNNGFGRPGGRYSSVDELAPPVDDNGQYYLEPGSPYGPENLSWSYTATPPSTFYAYYLSGAKRLINGDTLICDGTAGRFFEVTPEKGTVWQYINPYPYPNIKNSVFKIVYIPSEGPPEPGVPDLDCSGSFSWTNIKPSATVNGSFQVQNIGWTGSLLNWTINTSSITWGTWSFTPVSGKNLTPEEGSITVNVSVMAPNKKNSDYEGNIRIENQQNPNDFGLIPVSLTTPADIPNTQKTTFQNLLDIIQHHSLIDDLLFLKTFFKANNFFIKKNV